MYGFKDLGFEYAVNKEGHATTFFRISIYYHRRY